MKPKKEFGNVYHNLFRDSLENVPKKEYLVYKNLLRKR